MIQLTQFYFITKNKLDKIQNILNKQTTLLNKILLNKLGQKLTNTNKKT